MATRADKRNKYMRSNEMENISSQKVVSKFCPLDDTPDREKVHLRREEAPGATSIGPSQAEEIRAQEVGPKGATKSPGFQSARN